MVKRLEDYLRKPSKHCQEWVTKQLQKNHATNTRGSTILMTEKWLEMEKKRRANRSKKLRKSHSITRDNSRHTLKECKLCGKVEDRNWLYHWTSKHYGKTPRAVKDGQRANFYRWAQPRKKVNWKAYSVLFGDLRMMKGLPSETNLIDYAKKQLTAGKRVPYLFTEFGALAARQMFIEGIRIPKKIVPPTSEEEYEYTKIYNQEEQEKEILQLEEEIKQKKEQHQRCIAKIWETNNLELGPQQPSEKHQLPAGQMMIDTVSAKLAGQSGVQEKSEEEQRSALLAAKQVENAMKLLTRRKPFRADDPIRSYNGSAPGSPVQPATPPRSAFDFCKNPKLLASEALQRLKASESTLRKCKKANNADFFKFCERVANAGVRQDPSQKKKSDRKSSSDSSNYK